MKRLFAAVLAAVICLSFAACATEQAPREYCATVSGAEVDSGIFAYWYGRVRDNPADYGLSEKPSRKEITAEAKNRTLRYVAVNTLFEHYGLSLSNSRKISVSNRVNSLWQSFGERYSSVGITREALSKVCTSEAYTEEILAHLYNTEDENSEKKIRKYFSENYIVFRTASVYFTTTDATGTEIPMNDVQKNEAIKGLKDTSTNISDLETLEKITSNAGYTVSDTILLKKGTAGYPDGFFEDVQSINAPSCKVLVYDNCAFLVWRFDSAAQDEQYASVRSDCVNALYLPAVESVFSSIEDEMKVNWNGDAVNAAIRRFGD